VSRRAELARRVDSLARHWEPILGVAASSWRIRRMRTRWGSCNVRARRIWLNLALVDRPLECLEYVVVHELVHLHEPRHDARFHSWMDRHLPDWRERKALLNQPLLDQRRSRIFTNSASAAGSSD
jgi:predicted metal-dependent hydrolase